MKNEEKITELLAENLMKHDHQEEMSMQLAKEQLKLIDGQLKLIEGQEKLVGELHRLSKYLLLETEYLHERISKLENEMQSRSSE